MDYGDGGTSEDADREGESLTEVYLCFKNDCDGVFMLDGMIPHCHRREACLRCVGFLQLCSLEKLNLRSLNTRLLHAYAFRAGGSWRCFCGRLVLGYLKSIPGFAIGLSDPVTRSINKIGTLHEHSLPAVELFPKGSRFLEAAFSLYQRTS